MEKVSAIIPTVGRIDSLKKSVESVLNQTYPISEIIIVVDGVSPEVRKEFVSKDTSTIKVIETGKNFGGSTARNIGINNATGDWIALLDDDDTWLPLKIEKQINEISKYSLEDNVFAFTGVKIYKPNGAFIDMPRRKWNDSRKIWDYLFTPHFGRTGGFIQTSSILASKNFFIKNPFTEGLPKHQDWDWLIKAQILENLYVIYINDSLVSYQSDTSDSVGKKNMWQFSLKWIEGYKEKISKNAYDNFIITVVMRDLIKDPSIDFNEKRSMLKYLKKKVSIRNKMTLTYISRLLITRI